MSERDATGTRTAGDDSPGADGAGSLAPDGGTSSDLVSRGRSGDPTEPADAAERWMRRDDEFLLEEDREYVLRDEGRSWWGYVSPALFGAVLAVMVGDVVTTGIGLAMGLEEANPVAAALIREAGLAGLVLLKVMAAVVLLLLPGVTGDARRTFQAGSAVYLLVGLVVVASNAWAILAVAG